MEEIKEIQEGWEILSINETCDILDNKRIPLNSEERRLMEGNIPYYGANGVQGYINDFIFAEELILLAEDGGNFEEYSIRPIAYRIKGKSWVNNHAHVLRAKNNYSQDYIFYSIVNKNIIPYIKGGTRSKLNKSELLQIEIDIPKSKKEQQKIAKILSTIDQNIEKTEQIIEKYKKIKSGLMDDLLTGKIRIKDGKWVKETEFKEVEGIGRIPKDWEVNKLEKISKFVKDGTHGTHKDIENGIPLLSAKDIYNGKVNIPDDCRRISNEDYNSIHRKYELKEGDILLTIVGTIGRTAIIVDNSNKYTFQRSVGIVRLLKNYYSKYIFYYISSYRYQKQLKLMVNASAQGGIYLGSLSNTILCLPKQYEQIEIANVLSKQDQLIQKEQQYLQKLKKLKSGLMEKLLTGKVKVKIDE